MMSDVAIFRSRLERALAAGVLSFPLTAFDDSGAIDPEAFRVHLRHQLDAEPGALFACCGTGEFFSLAEDEYATLVAVAVEEAGGEVPVIAGVGYGWPQATRFAAAAVEAGADAGLLMPPYLVETSQAGIVAHVREVSSRTSLPLISITRTVRIAASRRSTVRKSAAGFGKTLATKPAGACGTPTRGMLAVK